MIPASDASRAAPVAHMTRGRPLRRAPSATAIVPATGRTLPVEPELADTGVLARARRRDLPRRGEDRERDREVVARALLPQRCRCEVDGDRLLRPLEQRGDDGAADAVLRLLARPVAHADDREARHLAGEQMRLDLDALRLEPDDRIRERACQHALDATAETVTRSCRLRAGSVTRAGRLERGRRARTRSTRLPAAPCAGSRAARSALRAAARPATRISG